MKKGFTLIELLVVVLIIGILAAIALPQYTKAVEKSRASEAIGYLESLAKAEILYKLNTGTFTRDIDSLDFEPKINTDLFLTAIDIPSSVSTTGTSFFQAHVTRKKDPETVGNLTLYTSYQLIISIDDAGNISRVCKQISEQCKGMFGSVCTAQQQSDWCFEPAILDGGEL